MRAYPRLPVTDSDIAQFKDIIQRLNAAVLSGRPYRFEKFESEAEKLAIRLNGGDRLGCHDGDDSPCAILERETAAPDGSVPLWGQVGNFQVSVDGILVRVELDGLYGGGFPAFGAHQVDPHHPFPISETGYRSFLMQMPQPRRITPDQYVIEQMRHYLINPQDD